MSQTNPNVSPQRHFFTLSMHVSITFLFRHSFSVYS